MTGPLQSPEKAAYPDLLLHACCGPCLEWPAHLLTQEGMRLQLYFFNPNIQPPAENRRRRETLQNLADRLGLPLLTDPACETDAWLGWSDESESRCRMCYRRRLTAAAEKASQLGIRKFSTTLLVSPWQDHAAIREIGESVAALSGVEFYYRDFRPGYQEGQHMAREDDLYRQRYCGCLPSLDQSRFKAQIMQDLAALPD